MSKTGTSSLAIRAGLDALAAQVRGVVRRDEPLSGHTTLGIGGPADLWVEPESADDLAALLHGCTQVQHPCHVLGGGSNVLVADAGVPGVVVHLPPRPEQIELHEAGPALLHATFPAGTSTSAVRAFARERGLIGPEFLVGIPGTLGGALQMNAGTRLGELSDLVVGAELVDAGGPRWVEAADFAFAYRHAHLPAGAVVTRIRLALRQVSPGELEASGAEAKAELARRHATQPRGRSAGSIFKNPPGDYAGRLIEACGLKERRAGGAVISPLHANFIVNDGGATARDVLELIGICRESVEASFGVLLELEVRLMGAFS